MASWAGGVCTAWTRKGFRFDGCVHWMVGTRPGDPFYNLYLEVGALEETTPIYNAEFIKIEIEGILYEVPMELSGFRTFLHTLAPEDTKKVNQLCRDIETMMLTALPTGAPSTLPELFSFLKNSSGFLSLAFKYLKMTVEAYGVSFQSTAIRSLLYHLMPKEYSMTTLIMMLGTRMSGNAGYPLGGASDIIARMEAKYRSLGGKINFNSKVDEIIIENQKAQGIHSKGIFYPSDGIIAACDAYDTLKNMLRGKFKHPHLDPLLQDAPLFFSLALVSFGLDKKFEIPYAIDYQCPEGIHTSPDTITYDLSLRSFEFDPSSAPEGCSSVMAMFTAPLTYWQTLRGTDYETYKKQKQLLADEAANALDRRIPGFKNAIVVTDVATPATYVRLANLYKGSFEGFAPTPESLKVTIRPTLPGVKNLVLCGQWTVVGGGICTAVKSGKDASGLILKCIK